MSTHKNFNYRIAEYFFNNNRLAILCFGILILLGTISTFLLKTTGFPNPEIKVAIIQTVYPGAAADTVAQTITEPLEGAIKDIKGVRTYISESHNSFSLIRVDLDESADANSVRNQIDAAVGAVALPTGAETPAVTTPDISDPDLIISIAHKDLAEVYAATEKITDALSEVSGTARVTPVVELERVLLVKLDPTKLLQSGITAATIQQHILSLGESIPVVNNVAIDTENQSIITAVTGTALKDIKNITLQAGPTSAPYRLEDLAELKIDYRFKDNDQQFIGTRSADGTVTVLPAVTLQIRAAEGVNVGEFTKTVEDLLASDSSTLFIKPNHETSDTSKVWVVENYTSNEFNQRQVHEVISGLIGGPLTIDGPAANVGWLLGGIQLVFLAMLAFVSWRAALVAAAAIPLSLVFANIYLFFTGNDLNTLVLFSLVLVIGLVVDPALVILESIQRKIDIGLTGKAAALAAIQDVGRGLFMATLTNIIVFVPFAVISGVLGQIFTYIPLTIIPAVIGSYIVPLIFLAWIGGLFLRPARHHSSNEVDNLWPVARWLIKTNTKILTGSLWIRVVIIIFGLAAPLALTGYLFSSGQMSVVQFASGHNGDFLNMQGTFFTNNTPEDNSQLRADVIKTALQNSATRQMYPIQSGFTYYINLQPSHERPDYLGTTASADIDASVIAAGTRDQFFDLQTKLNFVGPPSSNYPVAISITSPDPIILERSALNIGAALEQICLVDNTVTITAICAGERLVIQVDDGYTNKTNHVIEVLLDRDKLNALALVVPNAPLSILANQAIRQRFGLAATQSAGTINLDDYDTDVRLIYNLPTPTTVAEMADTIIYSLAGQTIRLGDIAKLKQINSTASVRRVKGETIGVVQAKLHPDYNNQGVAAQVTNAIVDYYAANENERTLALGLPADSIELYSEGSTANDNKSFGELFMALGLAIILSYVVLAVFFESFTIPVVILYAIPLSFFGIFPALAYLGNGQFGFLEIIGTIILVGIVENVAIFLIDAAKQKMAEGWDETKAISYASGVRLRPVLLTKLTAIASLAPLAFLSEIYRSISLVIMFGLLTSGITSLFTTPILFMFFRWLSRKYRAARWWNQILFFLFAPIYVIVWAIKK